METTVATERLTDALARAVRQWEKKGLYPEQEEPGFTIAVSREAGARGSQVARAVGKRLGWQVYDRELLEKIAEEMGLRTRLLESLDEKRVSWLQECMETLLSRPQINECAFVRRLIETVLSLASKGECVIVGRAAAQMLSPKTTLRVRLIGPVADRTREIEKRFGLTHAEAVRWVERTDAERRRFVWDHFNQDPDDPHLYDLTLNSMRYSVEQCADLIVEALYRIKAHSKSRTPEGQVV